MTLNECAVFIRGMFRKEQEAWERTRMLMYAVVQVNSRDHLTPKTLLPFPWDIEEEPEANEKASDDSEPLRLDEKLQRSRSKDLKSAFSLNDTFRFRRELFGNSAAEMTDALHMVEAMHSFDEAEDYFYGDLGWDRESDDVKEFMAIIKNHFL